MRIWDIPCKDLCRNHLLGEHRELHTIWSVIANNLNGYAYHPETMRWRGYFPALYERHQEQVAEMQTRGWTGHKTDLIQPKGAIVKPSLIMTIKDQTKHLQSLGCGCC